MLNKRSFSFRWKNKDKTITSELYFRLKNRIFIVFKSVRICTIMLYELDFLQEQILQMSLGNGSFMP